MFMRWFRVGSCFGGVIRSSADCSVNPMPTCCRAITDAILGAAGMGDIMALSGHRWSNKDADSRQLLARRACATAGWRINIDATVIAEWPRIAPHVPAMIAAIAVACEIPGDAINIKGKTTERLGFTGRGEGIAAHAVALLVAS
jgi:2-C-methyl-D-erythritol 2,4-cyclodiphosphate synthase